MTTKERIDHHLHELRSSGYEVVDGQPDITGWYVKARSGKKVGKVSDLLFEPHSRKVRYLIVDLDNNELDLDEDRKVLIPIGAAELYTKNAHYERNLVPAYSAYDPAEDGNVVYLHNVSAAQLDALPLYEPHHLSPHVEVAIQRIFENASLKGFNRDEFYRNEQFNDKRFYHR
jgi:hypothetical protein